MAADDIRDPAMQGRLARFEELDFGEVACIDTLFPEHARKIAHVIGQAACEDAALRPSIADAEDFHMVIIRAEKGKGASLHSHPTVEVFMPLSGEWTVNWGADGEHEIRLGLHDTISVPAGVMRGFTCESQGEHLLLAINGRTPGPIEWPAKTLEDARRKGYVLDEEGFVRPAGK